MATTRQKQAARRNIAKAGRCNPPGRMGRRSRARQRGLSTAEENRLAEEKFAFPKERKEPLTDAKHVRNAIARSDQVEDVSDAERDRAWKRILTAAKKFNINVSARNRRDLFTGGKARKR